MTSYKRTKGQGYCFWSHFGLIIQGLIVLILILKWADVI